MDPRFAFFSFVVAMAAVDGICIVNLRKWSSARDNLRKNTSNLRKFTFKSPKKIYIILVSNQLKSHPKAAVAVAAMAVAVDSSGVNGSGTGESLIPLRLL